MADESNSPKKIKNSDRLPWWIWICVVIAGVLVCLGIVAWLSGAQALDRGGAHLTDLGNFGSYLQGTVASFWALAGVVLIFVAFLVQKQQFQLQQAELELTREDLARQKDQLEAQEKSVRRQNFENSFFQFLSLYNQVVSQMRTTWTPSGRTEWMEGRTCFAHFYQHLQTAHAQYSAVANHTRQPLDFEKCYATFYREHQAFLGHYFRTLYHLIKFVKFSDVVVEYKDKRQYTSLVRAQLSAYELLLLYYNGLSERGKEFKPWIEEFGLLEHLDRQFLLRTEEKEKYLPSAFQ
jgi:Putative phage abortive infection protein